MLRNLSLEASFVTPGVIQFRFKVQAFICFSKVSPAKNTEMNHSLPFIDVTPATSHKASPKLHVFFTLRNTRLSSIEAES